MNMKNVLKKVLAVGASVAITASGALAAASLDSYPSPFVKDGKVNTMIVVGERASVADVVGAINIGASLQSAATSEVTMEGSESTSVSVSDGVLLERTGKELNLNRDLTAYRENFRETDLPQLLSVKELVSDSSGFKTVEYKESLKLGAGFKVKYGNAVNDEIKDADYLETKGTVEYIVKFDEARDFTALDNSETIELLGKEYTFSPTSTSTKLILYGATDEVSIQLNEKKTLEVGGKNVEFSVIGGTSASPVTAVLEYSGTTKSVSAGSELSINGESVRVKEVIVSDIGEYKYVIATLMVGSDELELADGVAAKLNGETLDAVTFDIVTAGDFTTAREFKFTFDFSQVEDDDGDDLIGIFAGERIVDPLFHQITIAYDGAKGGLTSGEALEVKGGSSLTFGFENIDGQEYFLSPVKLTTAKTGLEADKFILEDSSLGATVGTTFSEITTDGGTGTAMFSFDLNQTTSNIRQKFLYNEVIDATTFVTRVFEVREYDADDSYVVIRDIATGVDSKYYNNDPFYDHYVRILVAGATAGDFTTGKHYLFFSNAKASADTDDFMDVQLDMYTKNDMKISMLPAILGASYAGAPFLQYTEKAGSAFQIKADDITGSEDTLKLSLVAGTSGLVENEDPENDDQYYALTNHGTYVHRNDRSKITAYFPGEDAREFVAALGNRDLKVSQDTTVVAGQSVEKVNPMADYATLAKLDSEALSQVNKANMIVVGGPCANAVASSLLNQPADCAAGFEAGKATVRLFESGSYVSMLVAGYSAADTSYAANYVANYRSSELEGSSLSLTTGTEEVVVTESE